MLRAQCWWRLQSPSQRGCWHRGWGVGLVAHAVEGSLRNVSVRVKQARSWERVGGGHTDGPFRECPGKFEVMEALPVGVEDSHSSLRASMIVKFEARIEVMSRHMIIRAGEHVGRRHVENCGAMGEAQ